MIGLIRTQVLPDKEISQGLPWAVNDRCKLSLLVCRSLYDLGVRAGFTERFRVSSQWCSG